MRANISSETIEPITAHRWTEQFEALRMRTEIINNAQKIM